MSTVIDRLSKLDAPDIVAIFHEAVKKGWPDFTRRNASDFLRSYFGKEYRSISPERAKLVAQEYLDEYGVAADYPQEANHAE